MAEADIPSWLKNLPLAPEYRPTETEFADPIAFISRIEREAAAFGICKVIPPFPKPSKKFVLHNLNRSLSKSPELCDTSAASAASPESAVFTTRQQELGSRRARPAIPKQVWQSGDVYTLEQFEAKAKTFSRAQLGGFKEVTPLLVESLFWKAVAEKHIYIEYANDVPGSGFVVPEEPLCYISRRRNRKRGLLWGQVKEERCGFGIINSSNDGQPQKSLDSGSNREGWEGTSGWKLSNSRWNLQVIARSPGSLTRFMPDEVPGVTSPMVYIGMLFSWFAWHVEDHELHSMNFLHMGSPKTWYAVPGDYAATLEEIVRVQGYGGNVDRLEAFTMLGEKTTLLSPEVLVESGVPCCRLVQHPGEFVVTFPRAYHVGFSHGFNCGEAANFATPQWLKVAKEAAIRRAAMNHLPMLSHQQLLYILTMSFVSRVPRALISGARSSRMRDRKKEEREILVKKAFLTDMMNENYLLCNLLAKESSSSPVLWEPVMLPASCAVSQSCPISNRVHDSGDQHGCYEQQKEINSEEISSHKVDGCCIEKPVNEAIALLSTSCHDTSFVVPHKNAIHHGFMTSDAEVLEMVEDEGDLPVGLNVDSGSLACVACGILGFPFMAIVQPSEKASRVIFPITYEATHEKSDKSECLFPPRSQNDACNSAPVERSTKVTERASHPTCEFSPASSGSSQHSAEREIAQCGNNFPLLSYFPMNSVENKGVALDATNSQIVSSKCVFHSACKTFYSNGLCPCDSVKEIGGSGKSAEIDLSSATEPFSVSGEELVSSLKEKGGEAKWDISNVLLRPRVFCLQHAIEVEELLHSKGGGHVRVICHSDYLKIKAYAASIAEEIGADLDFKDVPLENASQDDLNLINISIDEEEYQEDGKDWTSHLGVNLRYCVKLRKHSPSSQEQLPSALSQIFSACSPISVVSGLRWLCRRSRTPAKPVGNIVERSYVSANVEGDVGTLKKNDTTSTKAIQVYQSRRKKPSDLAFEDYNPPVKELGNGKQNARVICRSEHIASASENIDNLFTVPIFIVGNHEKSQHCIEKQNVGPPISSINIADLNGSHLPVNLAVESCEVGDSILSRLNDAMIVSVPVRYQYSQVYCNISASKNSAMRNEEKCIGVSSINFDEGGYKCLDTQVGMAIPKSIFFEFKQLTVSTQDGSEHKLVDPCRKKPLLLTAGEDDYIQETPAEEQNTERSPRFTLLAEDHADVPRLFSDDSEMYIGVPVTEQTSSADCSVLGEGVECNVGSSEDEVRRIGIPAVRDSILGGEVSEILLKQPLPAGKSTGDNSKILQEPCPTKVTDGVPVIEGDVLQKLANNAADANIITGHVGNGYCAEVIAERNEKKSSDLNIILYVRRRNKRNRVVAQEWLETEKTVKVQKKAEAQKEVEAQHNSNGFVRSPCEGLRPRKGISDQTGNKILGRRISATKVTRRANLVGQLRKDKVNEAFHCDIEGCHMRFKTREELQLHKRNRCTYEECGKRFSNHKYAMRHQRVHNDERPLKCPWIGCTMSFKWEWAMTEHLRLHTGEKPYRCKVAGCGLSFRFVSDFSRHRRKTGHFVCNNTQ